MKETVEVFRLGTTVPTGSTGSQTIADQPRANEGGEARPDREDVTGRVGGRSAPQIA